MIGSHVAKNQKSALPERTIIHGQADDDPAAVLEEGTPGHAEHPPGRSQDLGKVHADGGAAERRWGAVQEFGAVQR